MGTCLTKVAGKKEKRKSFGDLLRSSQAKMEEKQEEERLANMPQRIEADNSSMRRSGEGPARKRKALQELHMAPPPAFRKFEEEVDWKIIDEEIAPQLWEDVFKPLYTF